MSKRILVIEDTEDNRQIIRDLLSSVGYELIEAMDEPPTNREVTAVLETAPISYVRAVLVSQHLKRLPVVDTESRLVGIISRADLVRELAHRWPS